MEIRRCYELLGGDYEQVLGRMLNRESMVRKFLLKFPEDKSYDLLLAAMAADDGPEAFREAHTLKGVCQNLSLDALAAPVSELTELLRDGHIPPEARAVMERVTEQYDRAVRAIAQVGT